MEMEGIEIVDKLRVIDLMGSFVTIYYGNWSKETNNKYMKSKTKRI